MTVIRTTVRVSKLEWRRGTGLLLAAVLSVAGVGYTALALPGSTGFGDWSASGPGIVMWLNTISLLLGPLAAAAGAWAGGRERRLGVGELLSAVPRSRWHRDTVTVAVLAVAAGAGMLCTAAVTFVSIRPGSAFLGGRWLLSVLLVLLGVAAYVALGFAGGRLLPHRWGAPVIGLAAYVLAGLPAYFDPGLARLAPLGNLPAADTERLRLPVALLAVLWVLGIAATALIAVSARRRIWALLPAVVAGLAVGSLVVVAGADGWTQNDPASMRPVCTTEAPTVCVTQVHKNLLAQVTPLARQILAKVPGVPGAAEDGGTAARTAPAPSSSPLQIPSLEGAATPFTGTLRNPAQLRYDMANALLTNWCPQDTDASRTAYSVAMALAVGDGDGDGESAGRLQVKLRGDDEATKRWLGRYLTAVHDCDTPALAKLVAS